MKGMCRKGKVQLPCPLASGRLRAGSGNNPITLKFFEVRPILFRAQKEQTLFLVIIDLHCRNFVR